MTRYDYAPEPDGDVARQLQSLDSHRTQTEQMLRHAAREGIYVPGNPDLHDRSRPLPNPDKSADFLNGLECERNAVKAECARVAQQRAAQQAVAQHYRPAPAYAPPPGAVAYYAQPVQPYEFRRPGIQTPAWFPIDFGADDRGMHLGLNAFGAARAGIMLGERTGVYAGSDLLATGGSVGLDVRPDPVGPGVRVGPGLDYTVLGGLHNASVGGGVAFRPDSVGLNGSVQAGVFGNNLGLGARPGFDIGSRGIAGYYDGYTNVAENYYTATLRPI